MRGGNEVHLKQLLELRACLTLLSVSLSMQGSNLQGERYKQSPEKLQPPHLLLRLTASF